MQALSKQPVLEVIMPDSNSTLLEIHLRADICLDVSRLKRIGGQK